MKLTRRQFVELGATPVGLLLAGNAGRAETRGEVGPVGEHGTAGTQIVKGHRALVAFSGLCAFVVDSGKTAMDVGLVKVDPKGPWALDEHFATLSVPRHFIDTKKTKWAPLAVSDKEAIFSLRDKTICLDYTAATTVTGSDTLKVSSTKVVGTKGNGLCPTQQNWFNFDWALDLAELHPDGPPAALTADWRQNLSATIKLRRGELETSTVPKLLPSQFVYSWQLAGERRRALKETIRYATQRTDELTLRASTGETLTLDLSTQDLLLQVVNLPLKMAMDPLNDMRAYYALVDRKAWPTAKPEDLPIPIKRTKCGLSATSDCGCCPATRFATASLEACS